MIYIGGISAGKCASKAEDIFTCSGKGAECVPLAGLVFVHVHLVRYQYIKEPFHFVFDELGRNGLPIVFAGKIWLPELFTAGNHDFVMRACAQNRISISKQNYCTRIAS